MTIEVSSTSEPVQLPETAEQWFVKKRPTGKLVVEEHLELKTVPLFPEGVQKEGKILVRSTHIQVDPTNLIWLTDSPAAASDRLYLPPIPAGQPVTAGVVGEVVASWHPEFNIGDRVYAYWSWADYVLVDVELMKVYRNPTLRVPDGVAAKDWIALALTGLTAYAGLYRTVQASKETVKTLVVNAAAGATGSTVIQLARNDLGIERIVAIAGSEEKCEFLRNVLKVDVALNYNDPEFKQKLIDATPNYIDLIWDNVAGPNLALLISRIAFRGKIVACGAISTYGSEVDETALPTSSYLTLAYQQATIHGIIFTAYFDEIPTLSAELVALVMQGKVIPFTQEVDMSLADVPKALDTLFEGKNVGKLVLRLQ